MPTLSSSWSTFGPESSSLWLSASVLKSITGPSYLVTRHSLIRQLDQRQVVMFCTAAGVLGEDCVHECLHYLLTVFVTVGQTMEKKIKHGQLGFQDIFEAALPPHPKLSHKKHLLSAK